MDKFALILVCILLGMAFRRFGIFPDGAAQTLNRFVIYVSLPALVLHYIHRLDVASIPLPRLLAPVAMPWMLLAGSFFLFSAIGHIAKWDKRTTGALVLTAGLGNTAFVGFAMVEAFYGQEGMQTAVLIDQIGSFLAMSIIGMSVAVLYSGQALSARAMARKILLFPPFIALIAACLLRPFPMPEAAEALLLRLGNTLVPLALTAVGMQLSFPRGTLTRYRWHLLAGLGYKLALAPALFYVLYSGLMDNGGTAFRVIILQSAMAPMITAGIIASEYGLKREIATLMVGIGIPLSLITVPLAHWLMG